MIGWAELDPNTPITPVVACETCKINTGVVSTNGVKKKLPACIYHSKLQILMKLAALIIHLCHNGGASHNS
jgi:hypothetical protein